MLPIFSISSTYCREGMSSSSEVADVCGALNSLKEWGKTHSIELKCRFVDPLVREEKDNIVQKLLLDDQYLPRIKRFLNREKSEAESGVDKLMELAEKETVYEGQYNTKEEYVVAALSAMDSHQLFNYVAMGKSVDKTISIQFEPSLKEFNIWLYLYRFHDSFLSIHVTLSSFAAHEDVLLQEIGKECIVEIESMSPFGDY